MPSLSAPARPAYRSRATSHRRAGARCSSSAHMWAARAPTKDARQPRPWWQAHAWRTSRGAAATTAWNRVTCTWTWRGCANANAPSWRASVRGANAASGVERLDAEARFTGPRTVVARDHQGHERHVEADLVFIDTGARPAMPTLPGLDAVSVLDSTSIMELAEVPGHLIVLGGGYVGLEFAQMFRRFGSRVTI